MGEQEKTNKKELNCIKSKVWGLKCNKLKVVSNLNTKIRECQRLFGREKKAIAWCTCRRIEAKRTIPCSPKHYSGWTNSLSFFQYCYFIASMISLASIQPKGWPERKGPQFYHCLRAQEAILHSRRKNSTLRLKIKLKN